MPDGAPPIEVKITADTSGLSAIGTAAQRLAAELKRTGGDLTKVRADFVETGATMSRAMSQAADQVKASTATMSRAVSEAATGGLTKLSVNAGEAREAIVLLHEALTGRFSRIPGSLLVLGERFNALGAIAGALTSPLGLAAVGATAVAAALGSVAYQAIEAENNIQETADALTVMGRSTDQTVDQLTAMRNRFQDTFALSTSEAGGLASAIAKLPGPASGAADAIAQIAVQVAKLKDEDLVKAAEETGKEAEKGGRAFLEWAQSLGFNLDPALVRAISELEETSGKVTSAQAAITALSQKIEGNVGAWQRDTAAVKQFSDTLAGALAVGGEGALGYSVIPGPGLPAKMPGAHPPPPSLANQPGFGAFGFDADPKATAAAEADANKAKLIGLQTEIAGTKELAKKIALIREYHAELLSQGKEGPAESAAKANEQIAAAQRAGARGGRGAENRDFQSFAENERLKLEEARGDWPKISAIYDEWAQHAASVYGRDSAQFRRVLVDKAEAARRAQAEMGQEALRTVSTQRSIDESYLSAFKAHMAELVATHRITKDQEFGFDIQYTAQLRDQLTQQLEAIKNNAALGVEAQRRAWSELVQVGASFQAKIAEDQARAAEASSTAWQNATRQIGDAFANAATDVITHTKSIAAAFDDLLNSLIKDVAQSAFKSLFSSILGTGGGGSSGSGGGGFFDGLFGSIFGGGILSLFKSGGAAADFDAAGGIGAATSFSSSGGGLFSGIGSFFSSILPSFGQGGIVPSAAGGWLVPQLGSGGVLAQLHSQEMVLPANVSNAVLANSGGGHTFNLGPIVAVDAPSVAKLFVSNGSALVAALNKALRNGAALYPGAIS